jgi:hypothetical protein
MLKLITNIETSPYDVFNGVNTFLTLAGVLILVLVVIKIIKLFR